jgi:hypothetical protein
LKRLATLATVLLVSALTFAQATQKIKTIQLKNERMAYAPAGYYISSVKDDRADSTDIGFVKTGAGDKKAILQLKGGTSSSISEFLSRNMKQDTLTTPVELHIIRMDVSEKRSNGTDKADISMGYAFYVAGEKVIELTSSSYVQSGLDATMYIEKMLRQQTESALKQFGEWFSENKNQLLAAPSVKVEVSLNDKSPDEDYLLYDPDRLLTYNDFKSKPDNMSLGAAATASSVSFDASTLTKGKEVTLKVKVAALFNTQKSWFKKEGMNPEVLSHEQLHFDITAYQVCVLINTLRNHSFSFDNYIAELQEIKKQADKNTELMQDRYDEETIHGTDTAKQAAWRKHITGLMTQMNCYKSP